jgi:PAS domain S-box-containing protein
MGDLLPLILDTIHEGVFAVDKDFRITSFNREAERITGVSAKLLRGLWREFAEMRSLD